MNAATATDLHPHEVEPAHFTVIDVRTPGEFAAGHLPGAINIPLDELPAAISDLKEHADDARLLLVCASGNRSSRARTALAEAGIPAASLVGGTTAWRSGGRDLAHPEGARRVWAMDRQVRFTAGLVAGGAVALDTVLPGARWAALAIGAGLVFSAVTDTCAMAAMLSKLPHNRPRTRTTHWREALTQTD